MHFFRLLLLILSASVVFAAEDDDTEGQGNTPASVAAPAMPEIPRTEPDQDLNRFLQISKAYAPDTKILELKTGKDEEKLLGLYQYPGQALIQGGIILFPSQATTPGWPDDLGFIRAGLADDGWHTLSILLPNSKRPDLPKRTLPVLSLIKPKSQGEDTEEAPAEEPAPAAEAPPSSEEETETGNETASAPATDNPDSEAALKPEEPFPELFSRYTNTAVKHLQTKEADRLILLGVGTGAVWAAQFAEQQQKNLDLRLIMINPLQPDNETAPDLLEIIPKLELTVLDIYHAPAFNNTVHNPAAAFARQRQKLVRHKALNNYRLSRLPARGDNWKKQQSWLLKHLRGLIRSHIIKAEMNNRSVELKQKAQNAESAPGN